jgi:hypothetical protein
MKLLILGATGKVGRRLVAESLKQGHTVTAFVRDPKKLAMKHDYLTPFTGDARDASALTAAMTGQNAILSALGHNSPQTTEVLTDATRTVLAHLQSNQRFISLTGDGALRDPKDPPAKLGGSLITGILKLAPGHVWSDGANHAQLLKASPANWVLVRSPRMTNGPRTKYRTGYLPVGLFTHATRQDVADFMLSNIYTDTWLRQTPIIVSE